MLASITLAWIAVFGTTPKTPFSFRVFPEFLYLGSDLVKRSSVRPSTYLNFTFWRRHVIRGGHSGHASGAYEARRFVFTLFRPCNSILLPSEHIRNVVGNPSSNFSYLADNPSNPQGRSVLHVRERIHGTKVGVVLKGVVVHRHA